MMYKVVRTLNVVNETLLSDHSIESAWPCIQIKAI